MDLIVETSSGTKYSMPVGDRNVNMIKNIITKFDHPHPGLLIMIILLVIMVIYYVYITRFKLDLSGEWFGVDYVVDINHNRWTDEMYLDIEGVKYGGWVKGDAVFLLANKGIETAKGVYHNKKILWTNGSTWRRPVVL
ncbi:MAG: hypothetical protein ACRCZI_07485 [Cetobacterium sp.]